jgi:hypothetical protein
MIRLAKSGELPRLLQIYDTARSYMYRSGNPTQWDPTYPGEARLLEDMAAKRLYVLEEVDRICACFMLAPGPDPTYAEILEGCWGSNAPYGVIHRVASDGTTRRVVAKCVAFAAQTYDHLRIDTHADNRPMQQALLREGFVHRGTVFAEDGTPRLAYDRF